LSRHVTVADVVNLVRSSQVYHCGRPHLFTRRSSWRRGCSVRRRQSVLIISQRLQGRTAHVRL